MIVAGAGSGKTRTLTYRIAHLIEKGVDPFNILSLTFTNKAAKEMKERIIKLVGRDARNIMMGTFHSVFAKILRVEAEKLGYMSNFTIYDTDDAKSVIKSIIKEHNLDPKIYNLSYVIDRISKAKSSLISSYDYQNNVQLMTEDKASNKPLIANIYQEYNMRLRRAMAMDFDDLLFYMNVLLRDFPEVLYKYQERYRYIHVDEYQDTNFSQYLIIKKLAARFGNICVVGDDAQSIYAFRGANIQNILNFKSDYPDCQIVKLEQNYRSTQNILDAANAVIRNNKERKGKTLWTENNAGSKIGVHTAYSETDEANYIANKILESVPKRRKFSDYAILYRMNSQSNIIEKIFVKSGIPYRIIGGKRFYERKEIKDMIAYLCVINNPNDEVRLRRIINQPKRSIGDKTISSASEIAGGIGESLFYVIKNADQFEDLKRTAPKLLNFANLMQELIDASNDESVSLNDLYQLILEKTDYISSLKASENDDAQDRIDNINELASNLIKYEEDNGEEAGLSGFLEEVSLLTDIDNYDEKSDSVVMMTVHSAKGLEFPTVFLPGFEEGIFPGMQAIYDENEIEEERRLAYVAITRAKEELFVINAESRMLFGSTSRNKQSRFVEEIPEELTIHSRSRAWKKPKPGTELPVSANEARAITTEAARNFGPSNLIHSQPPKFKPIVGDTVMHRTFGKGTIITATPMGNDTLLEIVFDKVGTKKIMANYARLQKV